MLPRVLGKFLLIATLLYGGLSGAWAQSAPLVTADAASAAKMTPATSHDKKDGKGAVDDSKTESKRKPFDSLMFATDEYNEIQSRIASGAVTDTNQGKQAIEDATLYLSTIVYYGPKDWTIWVNGVPIGPSQEFQAFQVTEIDPNSVELLVPLSAQGMRPVRLSPNQTFITKTGLVVEGRVQ